MNTTVLEKPTHPSDSTPDDNPHFAFDSAAQKQSIRLSHRALTIMLVSMCIVPVVTIGALWAFLPSVQEGELEAFVFAEGLPSADFYSANYEDRPTFDGGVLVVENRGDLDWTHLINIQINGHYQIYDRETLPAHSVRRYKLNKFWNRTGVHFSLQYNELKRVRIYARRPDKGRASYDRAFLTARNAEPNEPG